jgi:vitamin B12 transporter
LNSVVGLEINGNQSGAGKNLGVYIRGGRNRQTLILIDGIPVTDASGINLEFDLRLIPIEQVESIEIMKGASSTLYGTGAATGVITITLKKASRKLIEANAYFNMGTQMTANKVRYTPQDFNQGFSANGHHKSVRYFASINSTETKGISEAKGLNFEDDRFSRVNSLVKFGVQANSNLNLDFSGNYDKIKNNFDGTFDNFSNPDTPENVSNIEQFRFGFSPKYKYSKGEFVLNSSINTIRRNYSTFDSWSNSVGKSDYSSRTISIDAYNKYTFSKKFFAVLGTQFQFLDMEAQSQYEAISSKLAQFNTKDAYFTAVYNFDSGLNINTGARYNTHSVYKNHFVFNVNSSYSFQNSPLKLLASYSTAYITPSLYQLYSPYGNLDLTPEENSTIEAGFEINAFKKRINFNTVAFYREEKNSIGFYTNPDTFASNYINIQGRNNVKGVESMVSFLVFKALKLDANYAYTFAKAPLNSLIPKHKINFSADYQASKRTYFSMNYLYVHNRNSSFFDGGTYKLITSILDSYQVVNATAKYDLIPNKMSVFGTVSNLFNKDFEENIGYSTRGRNFKLGIAFHF